MAISTGYAAPVFIEHVRRRNEKCERLATDFRARFPGAPGEICAQTVRLQMEAADLHEHMEGMSLVARRYMPLPSRRR
jgi:hypothetical protein